LRFGSFWNFLHLRTMTTLLILPYAAIGQVAVWGTVIITLLVAAAAYIFKQKPPHFPVRSGCCSCGDCLACRTFDSRRSATVFVDSVSFADGCIVLHCSCMASV